MQYRKDRYGNPISALGFGCMRFTRKGRAFDIDKAEKEVLRAIELGVNYFDTAYLYVGNEACLGEILSRNHLREKVNIATKLPQYKIVSAEGIESCFQEELRRLKTDYIDYYLMHMRTDIASWERLEKLGIRDWIARKKREGAIRQIGFSFHGNTEMFLKILNAYDWDFCQIQYNYMDVDYQAGERGLKQAAERGLGVVVMEPLKGGKLAIEVPPNPVKSVFDKAETPRKPAEWALQWLWNQPEVGVVLSGMSTFEQVEQNLASANHSGVGSLSEDEVSTIEKVRDAWQGLAPVACTHCEYCLPCPSGVLIPQIFAIYNTAKMYDQQERGQNMYQNQIPVDSQADACIECGTCESLCPQNLTIIDYLKDAHAYLSER